jgi:hypothetical protein
MNIFTRNGEWDYEQVSDDKNLQFESLGKEIGALVKNRM